MIGAYWVSGLVKQVISCKLLLLTNEMLFFIPVYDITDSNFDQYTYNLA